MRWSRRGEEAGGGGGGGGGGRGGGGGGEGKCWWWRHVALLVVLLLVMSLVMVVETTPPARGKGRGARGEGEGEEGPGSRGSNLRLRTKPEWKKRHRKSSECRLGKNRYSLGEQWSPNLGPPFGVWNCVRCVCAKVQRKRRVVGKVRCRNIKTECPKVTCVDPVLLPGMCCKMCVTQTNAPFHREGVQWSPGYDQMEDEELTGRDFAVLLNGRTSMTPMTTTRVATGRLFLRRRTLHFSFLLEHGAPTPSSIQFLNESGEILEQLEPQPTPYEATNSRVCGTWTRLPREYRTLLLEEKMWVALNPPENSEEDVISGQVSRYVGVDTEVFSALLTPTHHTADTPSTHQNILSGGGTAIISVDRKTDSLHVSLVFNGVFGVGETHNVSIGVELLPERALEPVTDTIVLPKVYSDVNRAELLTTLGERSLIRLTRGQVSIKIWSLAAPHLVLEGAITPRATCNVFCAVLSEPPPDASTALAVSPPPYGAGWALVTLSNDGTFHYQVFVQDLTVTSLTLETRHRRRHRQVSDLTTSFRDGWANGTYERPTYRDLDALLRGRVEVVVADGGNTGRRLQGTLSPVAVTEALRSPQPVLLASPDVPMAAAVWVAVDAACVTHYDVMVAGRPPNGAVEPSWSLVLREDDHSWDPRYKLEEIYLEDEVQGWELFAHTLVLMHVSLSRLGAEVSYLDLKLLPNTTNPQALLTGRVRGVSVPATCLLDPSLFPDSVTIDPPCTELTCLKEEPKQPPPITNKCIDEDKKVYNNGKSWVSPEDHCRMCMCTKGLIQCHDRICPALDCAGAYTPPDQCCPVCPDRINLDETEMCQLNEQNHHVGSVWHPFLAPHGFDRCVSCSCELNSLGRATVKCFRSRCPDLPCGPGQMEYVAGSCCAQCRPPKIVREPNPTASPDIMNEGALRTEEDLRNSILNNGGCIWNNILYENGDNWHPRINTIGYYKCVVCNCKQTNITCHNVKCPTIQCQEIMLDRQECCPHCVNANSTVPRPRGKKRRNKSKSRRLNSG